MSDVEDVEDVDFVEKVIRRSESLLCGKIADLQKEVRECNSNLSKLEASVGTLESDNMAVRQELEALKHTQCPCVGTIATAFTAALNTVNTVITANTCQQSGVDSSSAPNTPVTRALDFPSVEQATCTADPGLPDSFQAKRLKLTSKPRVDQPCTSQYV